MRLKLFSSSMRLSLLFLLHYNSVISSWASILPVINWDLIADLGDDDHVVVYEGLLKRGRGIRIPSSSSVLNWRLIWINPLRVLIIPIVGGRLLTLSVRHEWVVRVLVMLHNSLVV